jgi:hypothetical protein
MEYQQKQKRFAKRVVRTPRPDIVRSPREDVIVSSPYRSVRNLDVPSPFTRPLKMESVVQPRVDSTSVPSTPIYSGTLRAPTTPVYSSVVKEEPVLAHRNPRAVQTTPEIKEPLEIHPDRPIETRVEQVKKHQPVVSSPLANDTVRFVDIDH